MVHESPLLALPPTQPLTTTPLVGQPAVIVPASEPPETALESAPAPQTNDDHYRDGIVIWETPESAKVPFLLKFNVNTQLRYLNTLDSNGTYTDHLGVTHDVHARNDITVNRAMFILGGYIFNKKRDIA